jgi:Flp pilus assembly protein TadD
VRYFRVLVAEVWSRDGDLLLANQHVDLSIENLPIHRRTQDDDFSVTVDFLPPEELRGQLRSEIGEQTVMAMFLNNLAAEHLVAGHRDDAYWSARAAVSADPAFLPAYNTLGVVYLRAGKLAAAERTFDLARSLEPENPQVLSNLEHVYRAQGRSAAAERVAEQLRQLEPVPPYHYFLAALASMRKGDFRAARNLLERELKREPYNHEVLFGMAIAWFNLGDMREAQHYLALARDNSTTLRSRVLYQAKLEHLTQSTVR